MATVLELVNNVLPEVNLPKLTTLVGNGNATALRTLSIANREGKYLATKPWRILVKRRVITTASSAPSYTLPSDFKYFVDTTFWNDSNDDPMIGPVSDIRWQADLSGLLQVTVDDRFQIRADGNKNKLFIRPIPTSAEDVTFFYVSDSWCTSAGGDRQSEWLADDDEFLLDDYVYELGIKWRLLRSQRREFQDERAEYEMELKKAIARDGGMEVVRVLGPQEEEGPTYGRIPDTGYGS